MGILRTVLHIATFGIFPSNGQVKWWEEEKERRKEEERRRSTPFCFPKNMTETEFNGVAIKTAKPIKRLAVSTDAQFVRGTVRTVSGINTWNFTIDFNDFGTLTGRYWMRKVENEDSDIPSIYAEQLKEAIVVYLNNGDEAVFQQRVK